MHWRSRNDDQPPYFINDCIFSISEVKVCRNLVCIQIIKVIKVNLLFEINHRSETLCANLLSFISCSSVMMFYLRPSLSIFDIFPSTVPSVARTKAWSFLLIVIFNGPTSYNGSPSIWIGITIFFLVLIISISSHWANWNGSSRPTWTCPIWMRSVSPITYIFPSLIDCFLNFLPCACSFHKSVTPPPQCLIFKKITF